MTPEELVEGRRLLEAATRGPWVYFGADDVAGTSLYANGWIVGDLQFQAQRHDARNPDPDGFLIAWALNHLAELLDIAERGGIQMVVYPQYDGPFEFDVNAWARGAWMSEQGPVADRVKRRSWWRRVVGR